MKEDLYRMTEEQYGIPPLPKNPVPAMAYIPYQAAEDKTYSPEQGLMNGTLFPGYFKDFYGCGGMER